MYVDASLAKVILSLYKETSGGKAPRRVKKKEEVYISSSLQGAPIEG